MNAVVAAVLKASDPREATARAVRGRLSDWGLVFAVGKAAAAMARGFKECGGIDCWPPCVITPEDADHPVPTERNVLAAERVLEAIESWRHSKYRDDGGNLVLLLSGGASALLTLPAPGLTVDDVAEVTSALLRAGAPIEDLNSVRKHIDMLKGGWLAKHVAPKRVEQFVLSDVLGDRLDVIGSGPCVPDPTTYADAIAVLDRSEVWDAAARVRAYLEAGARGKHPETPKPGDPVFDGVRTTIVGSNAMAVDAAVAALRSERFEVRLIERGVVGEAVAAGRRLGAAAKGLDRGHAIVWGGETTVTVGVAKGIGGRNQELALAAAIEIDGAPNCAVATFATDGVDGPTDAAGAMVTGESCRHARSLGMDPRAFLSDHDSHTIFARLDVADWPHLIRTGPTGTNVNDVAVALRY